MTRGWIASGNSFGDYSANDFLENALNESKKEYTFFKNLSENHTPQSEISVSTLKRILRENERKNSKLRTFIYEVETRNPSFTWSDDYLPWLNDLPVSIEVLEKTIVITMPALVKKDFQTPRYIKMNLRAAFTKYRCEHPELPLNSIIASPVSLAIIRIAPHFSSTNHVDNDNYEVHDAINAVMEELGISDNAENMDYSVIFRSDPNHTACTKLVISNRRDSLIRLGNLEI